MVNIDLPRNFCAYGTALQNYSRTVMTTNSIGPSGLPSPRGRLAVRVLPQSAARRFLVLIVERRVNATTTALLLHRRVQRQPNQELMS